VKDAWSVCRLFIGCQASVNACVLWILSCLCCNSVRHLIKQPKLTFLEASASRESFDRQASEVSGLSRFCRQLSTKLSYASLYFTRIMLSFACQQQYSGSQPQHSRESGIEKRTSVSAGRYWCPMWAWGMLMSVMKCEACVQGTLGCTSL
jgi:hypothetical protein